VPLTKKTPVIKTQNEVFESVLRNKNNERDDNDDDENSQDKTIK